MQNFRNMRTAWTRVAVIWATNTAATPKMSTINVYSIRLASSVPATATSVAPRCMPQIVQSRQRDHDQSTMMCQTNCRPTHRNQRPITAIAGSCKRSRRTDWPSSVCDDRRSMYLKRLAKTCSFFCIEHETNKVWKNVTKLRSKNLFSFGSISLGFIILLVSRYRIHIRTSTYHLNCQLSTVIRIDFHFASGNFVFVYNLPKLEPRDRRNFLIGCIQVHCHLVSPAISEEK